MVALCGNALYPALPNPETNRSGLDSGHARTKLCAMRAGSTHQTHPPACSPPQPLPALPRKLPKQRLDGVAHGQDGQAPAGASVVFSRAVNQANDP
jgi:hypothetical protein